LGGGVLDGGGLDGGGLIAGGLGTVNVNPLDLFKPTLTMTGPVTASAGTTTYKDVLLAPSTRAGTVVLFAPAKVTMFSAAFTLKPSPVIMTVEPAWPLGGSRLVTVRRRSSGNDTTYIVKYVTSAEAIRPDSSVAAKNLVVSY